ncbi:MAG: Rpn family recombination-promoting nuclease/putative transposase [Planctomycetaceae bacterium]|nr:Rpn family recombination-promoting nuclease/putative transposase [Planctomycetaceae bacterium]
MQMPLGIKAYLDFVFKKMFGSPENSIALIGLLNAILDLPRRITDVTILNPFSYQEFQTAKMVVLDVKAADSGGRYFNIEMQIVAHASLLQRLVYYASEMYTDQLSGGDQYDQLNSTISICLLKGRLFADSDRPHHRFQMMDAESHRKLDRAIEVHTVELAKFPYDATTISIAPPLAQWSWLILNAHHYSSDELKRLFPDLAFQNAIRCLESISSVTEDKAMHDQREKAERDHNWMLASARQQGLEQGLEQGIEQGLEQGLEQGIKQGTVAGAIQALQQVLGDPVSSTQDLSHQSVSELQTQLAELQTRIRSRLK